MEEVEVCVCVCVRVRVRVRVRTVLRICQPGPFVEVERISEWAGI